MDPNSKVFAMIDQMQPAPPPASLPSRDSVSFSPNTALRQDKTAQHVVGLIAGLQFAVVILISQRRLPVAHDAEFVVVMSMLMITAAHQRIIQILPEGDSLTSNKDIMLFLFVSVPIFLYMIVIESWFLVYLFSYTPELDLPSFGDNASKILGMAKTLSVLKLLSVFLFVAAPFIVRYRTK